MAFEFKPGAPKPSLGLSLSELKNMVKAGEKIESAKSLGGGIVKVFLSGTHNANMTDSQALRRFLRSHGQEV